MHWKGENVKFVMTKDIAGFELLVVDRSPADLRATTDTGSGGELPW